MEKEKTISEQLEFIFENVPVKKEPKRYNSVLRNLEEQRELLKKVNYGAEKFEPFMMPDKNTFRKDYLIAS